jgi:ABC-type multidrug transport system ATPase subunit
MWMSPDDESISSPSHRRFSIATLFTGTDDIVVGRAADCGICLPHPLVGSYHVVLERVPQGIRLIPLKSDGSVSVEGAKTSDPTLVHDGQRFGIGPYLFKLSGASLLCVDSSQGIRLEARGLERCIRLPGGRTRKLITGVDLVVEPGEFVCLLGPSGAGKTTLMDCLNGRRRATAGQVLANGENFYAHFDHFRRSLGYVPQRDIVHTQLTVYRALHYTAQLRLPPDTLHAELQARIETVLAEMELDPHRNTLIADLSGGQLKRVSLGAELLAGPSLLYIDEATSGLDAGIEARMMRLFRQLADDGRSVICITHNVDNVDQCHLVLILAAGRPVYYGPPEEAPRYFGVSRLGQIYDRLSDKPAEIWETEFACTSFHQEFVARRLERSALMQTPACETAVPHNAPPTQSLPAIDASVARSKTIGSAITVLEPAVRQQLAKLTQRVTGLRMRLVPMRSGFYQFRILTARYCEILLHDFKSLRLLLLQAPIVGLILALGLVHLTYTRTMPWNERLSDSDRQTLTLLHNFNQVLSAASNNTVEQKADSLKQLDFNVAVRQQPPQHRSGYELAKDLRRRRQLLIPLEQEQIVLGSRSADAGGRAASISLSELEALTAGISKVDQTHTDLPEQLLQMDSPQMPIVPRGTFFMPQASWSVMFILAVTIFWFGCNNAAKEIVKEEAIYARERAASLGIVPYICSKFVVLGLVSIFQALTVMFIVLGALHLSHADFPPHNDSSNCIFFLPYGQQFLVLALLSLTGAGCGLLISACVDSPDRANALTPYVLIPQIILAGSFIPVEGIMMKVMSGGTSPVYWAYRALHQGTSKLPSYFQPQYHDPDYGVALTLLALTLQLVVLLLAAAWFLRRKDVATN